MLRSAIKPRRNPIDVQSFLVTPIGLSLGLLLAQCMSMAYKPSTIKIDTHTTICDSIYVFPTVVTVKVLHSADVAKGYYFDTEHAEYLKALFDSVLVADLKPAFPKIEMRGRINPLTSTLQTVIDTFYYHKLKRYAIPMKSQKAIAKGMALVYVIQLETKDEYLYRSERTLGSHGGGSHPDKAQALTHLFLFNGASGEILYYKYSYLTFQRKQYPYPEVLPHDPKRALNIISELWKIIVQRQLTSIQKEYSCDTK